MSSTRDSGVHSGEERPKSPLSPNTTRRYIMSSFHGCLRLSFSMFIDTAKGLCRDHLALVFTKLCLFVAQKYKK